MVCAPPPGPAGAHGAYSQAMGKANAAEYVAHGDPGLDDVENERGQHRRSSRSWLNERAHEKQTQCFHRVVSTKADQIAATICSKILPCDGAVLPPAENKDPPHAAISVHLGLG